jgi:hypothetical protein
LERAWAKGDDRQWGSAKPALIPYAVPYSQAVCGDFARKPRRAMSARMEKTPGDDQCIFAQLIKQESACAAMTAATV